ncbi:unknown [Brachyspira sp. CAG:700]|nr:unknown [Brachyspira sp. CAG:700]
MLLSVLVFAFASCKSNENPEGGGSAPFKVSSIVGTWSGEGVSFTIDNNGNVKMTMADGISVDKSFQIPEADWNSEKTEYTIKGDGVGLIGASITFKSATSGTATSTAGTTDIKKTIIITF